LKKRAFTPDVADSDLGERLVVRIAGLLRRLEGILGDPPDDLAAQRVQKVGNEAGSRIVYAFWKKDLLVRGYDTIRGRRGRVAVVKELELRRRPDERKENPFFHWGRLERADEDDV